MFFLGVALSVNLVSPHNPYKQNLRHRLEGPSVNSPLGRDDLGRCILSRIIYGARTSLYIGGLVHRHRPEHRRVSGRHCRVLPPHRRDHHARDRYNAGLSQHVFGPGHCQRPGAGAQQRDNCRGHLFSAHVLPDNPRLRFGREGERVRGGGPGPSAPAILPSSSAISCPIPWRPSSCKPRFTCPRRSLPRPGSAFWAWACSRPWRNGAPMLGEGRVYLRVAPHVAIFPGLAIMVVVLGFNLFGDGLRDALDPRLK